jgi:E3 ubiquitin-protein ligase MYCBP2
MEHLPCLKHELQVDEDFCPICYVETLAEAPCVLVGPCGHAVHWACIQDRFSSKWPDARLSFAFLSCPLCQGPIDNRLFDKILAPLITLKKKVESLSLQRLEHEGRQKDAAIISPTGAYYKDPLGFAMREYLFYMCFKCSRPYFAGNYECQEAGEEYNPEELVCGGCQPMVGGAGECSLHGKDWLTFKCRYCCSYAAFHCWDNTHFCHACHKSGVWQTLVTFRTGKNKQKLWHYPQCPGILKAVTKVVETLGLTDAQIEERCALLRCDKSLCPVSSAHPPSGIEWGLGCSMCEDKKAEGLNERMAAKADQEQQILQAKLVELRALIPPFPTGRAFVHTSDLDHNGVLWFLGTGGLTHAWANPCEAGLVKVSTSGIMEDSAPLSAVCATS